MRPGLAITLLASAALLQGASPARQAEQSTTPEEQAQCFNFSVVKTYKVTAAGVRLELDNARKFDVSLADGDCPELGDRKHLAITNVPVGNLCVGEKESGKMIVFSEPDTSPLRCRIKSIAQVAD